jgi:hypothetical protein
VTASESVGRFLEVVSRLSVVLITPHSLASTPVLKSESTGNRMQTGEAQRAAGRVNLTIVAKHLTIV